MSYHERTYSSRAAAAFSVGPWANARRTLPQPASGVEGRAVEFFG
jgi:hypothetical protein